MDDYTHGYTEQEFMRLTDQADTLAELLHKDTVYPQGSLVLEVGCGTGAQTTYLAKNSPEACFICIDKNIESIMRAIKHAQNNHISNANFQHMDVYELPFEKEAFDHAFVCFVLEHLNNPFEILNQVKDYLKPGGSITVIEGDHGSARFHPYSADAQTVIDALVTVQEQAGGDAHIGRQLYPMLQQAGFEKCQISPRTVYADASRPNWVDGFTRKTFISMVEGVRDKVLSQNLLPEDQWDKGIADLYRTTEADGTFTYIFYKAVAFKPM